MSKLPAIQFYPGDWRKDPGVQSLSYEERGIWLELLFMMHESEKPGVLLLGGVPYPTDRLARALRLDNQVISKVISELITLNVASIDEETGALMCRRMVRDRQFVESRKKCGKLGGNPNFKKGKSNPYYSKDNQKHNQTDNLTDKQKITPSSSTSLKMSDCDFNQSQVSQFESFWSICPRKTAKGSARKAWVKAIKTATPDQIIAAMKVYATATVGTETQYIAHPATWLNAERWLDDFQPPKKKPRLPDTSTPEGMSEIAKMFTEGLNARD
jgi:hypothetical protein